MSIIIETAAITAIASVVGAALSFFTEYFQRSKKKNKEESLDEKVKKLTNALGDSANLIGHIQSEIKTRHKLVEKLKKDHEQYDNLVKLKQEEVEAVAQLFRGEIQKENSSSFIKNILANFIFFVLGSIVSLAIAFYIV